MKRYLVSSILLFTSILLASAQQVEVGLRDNQFARADFKSSQGWLIGYEQSLLNVRVKEQSGRLFAGYVSDKKTWAIRSAGYYGSEFSGSWFTTGAIIDGTLQFPRVYFEGILNPNYDSDLGFNFCYQAEFGVGLLNTSDGRDRVELFASYGDIPEFRLPTQYIRTGLKFTSNNLWVKPALCFPLKDAASGQKYLRVICSFGWAFNLIRR